MPHFSPGADETPEEWRELNPEWIHQYVRVNFAEHHSQLYDRTPRDAIELAVALTIIGLFYARQDPLPPWDSEEFYTEDHDAEGTGT